MRLCCNRQVDCPDLVSVLRLTALVGRVVGICVRQKLAVLARLYELRRVLAAHRVAGVLLDVRLGPPAREQRGVRLRWEAVVARVGRRIEWRTMFDFVPASEEGLHAIGVEAEAVGVHALA